MHRWFLLLSMSQMGCIDFLGMPPASTNPALQADTGGYFAAPKRACDAYESEPNDLDPNGIDTLTAFHSGQQFTLCGELSEISTDGSSITGDFDFFQFGVTDGSSITFDLQWPTSSTLYFSVYDVDREQWHDSTTHLTLSSAPSFAAIGVYGVDGPPTDYTLEFSLD